MGARLLLTINTGSSSFKTALYRLRKGATETSELRAETSRVGTQQRERLEILERTATGLVRAGTRNGMGDAAMAKISAWIGGAPVRVGTH